MRFLIFGAGAIGTYFGTSLIKAGDSVSFIEIPPVAEQIKKGSFSLQIDQKTFSTGNFKIYSSAEKALENQLFDVSIFALKSFDTDSAIQSLLPIKNQLPPFLCLQNGVENETKLANAFGKEKVIHGTVTTAIAKTGLGAVKVEKLRGVGIEKKHFLSDAILHAFDTAGLNPVGYAHPASMKWSKMLTNLLANATSAILDWSAGQVFAHPLIFRLELEQIREALRVMQAYNIPVTNLPGTPVRALAFAIQHLPAFISQPFLQQAVGKGRGNKMPSFHIDLHSGRGRIEVDYLNGAVARFGAAKNLPTPVNTALNKILIDLNDGNLNLSDYSSHPERLLANITY